MTRSRTGAAALLLATFVLGGLVGGAATTMVDRRAHRGDHPGGGRPSYLDRLANDLGLDRTQRDSVQAVLDRHQPAMDSLWQVIRPQFQSERQLIRNQINALLTPEQQAKYTQLQRQDSLRRAEGDRSRNGHR
jgi:Spy/CpxP family protein refolding chaperone